MNVETYCEGCVFAVKNEKKQTGCELYRSEKLGVKETHLGSYVLNRYCNAYRPDEWV